MIHYFKLFLDKLLCKHIYDQQYVMDIFGGLNPIPENQNIHYTCRLCGKSKTIVRTDKHRDMLAEIINTTKFNVAKGFGFNVNKNRYERRKDSID